MSFRNWLLGKCKITMRGIVYTPPLPLPREGGRMPLHEPPMKRAVIRECHSPHSSFRAKARNLFRSRKGKGCERNGQWETPCSRKIWITVFHANRSTQEKEHGKRKRSLGCARDDNTRIPLSRTTFIPLRCQPPPLRGTSFQGKEGECRSPAFVAHTRFLIGL